MAKYLDSAGVKSLVTLIDSKFLRRSNVADGSVFKAGTGITLTPSTTDGTLTIAAKNSGTVTSVTAGNGLSGGTITSSGTISLPTTGVTAGKYGDTEGTSLGYGGTFKVPSYTVDGYGRLTASSTLTFTLPASDNTDSKVTSVGNHYTPSKDDNSKLEADASSTTSASWGSTQLVTGVSIERDAKGHVTGLAVDSIKLPSNPNSNTWRPVQVNGTQVLAGTTGTNALNLKEGNNITLANSNGTVTISTKGVYTSTEIDGMIGDLQDSIASNVTSLLEFKGTIGGGGSVSTLPATHSVGDTYIVKTTAGNASEKIAGVSCQSGDMIVCITNGTTSTDSHWTVVQGNGQVTNKNATLAYGNEATIATIDGVDIKVTMPAKPTLSDFGGISSITHSSSTTTTAEALVCSVTASGNTVTVKDFTGSVGNNKTPIYFNAGVPTALGYTIEASVPSDAKFTDTTYSNGTGMSLTNRSFSVNTATTSTRGAIVVAGTRSSVIETTQGGTTTSRYYGVEIDSNGKAFVNVPWTNSTDFTKDSALTADDITEAFNSVIV